MTRRPAAARGHRLPGRRQPHRLHRRCSRPAVRRRRAVPVPDRRAERHLRRRDLRDARLVGTDRRRSDRAGKLLRQFWSANSASSPPERMMNTLTMWASQVAHFVATPEFSPYDIPTSDMAFDHLRSLLTKSVDFGRVPAPSSRRSRGAAIAARRRRRRLRRVQGVRQLPRARSPRMRCWPRRPSPPCSARCTRPAGCTGTDCSRRIPRSGTCWPPTRTRSG